VIERLLFNGNSAIV